MGRGEVAGGGICGEEGGGIFSAQKKSKERASGNAQECMKPKAGDAAGLWWSGDGFGRMLVSEPAQSGKGRSWNRCPPEQGRILWPCSERAFGQRWHREHACSVGIQTARVRARCPGHTWTPRACRQWVLGRGEEDFSTKFNLLENLACSPSS